MAASDQSFDVAPEEQSTETDVLRIVLAAMDNAFAKIRTTHFRKISDIHVPELDIKRYHKKVEAMEQVYQRKPRSSHYTMHPDAHYLIRGRENLVIVPEQRKIISRTKKEKHERAWLEDIYKFNSEHLLYWYDLEVEQLTRTPYFLFVAYDHLDGPALYSQTSLYRLTGAYQERFVSEDPNVFRSPPISKIEFYIDIDLGIIVGIREYWWHDQKDTSQGDYLAVSDVVMERREIEDNIALPISGIRHEAARGRGFTPARTILWSIDYAVVNKPIDPEVFSVEGYRKSQGYEEW